MVMSSRNSPPQNSSTAFCMREATSAGDFPASPASSSVRRPSNEISALPRASATPSV